MSPNQQTGQNVLYALLCEGNRVYIGSCERGRLPARLQEHNSESRGAAFTRAFRPVELVETRLSTHPLDEDRMVLEYMNQWRAEGYADWINRVRGGTYSMINLPAHQIQTLQDQLNHATRACMICGGTNHYASQCQRRNYPRNPITSRSSMSLSPRMNDPDSSEDSDSAYESETLMHGDLRRYSRSIPSRTSDQYGRVNQYARFYYSGTNNANRCFRCGRAGHFASSCFARVHVDGTLLKQSYNTIYDSESD